MVCKYQVNYCSPDHRTAHGLSLSTYIVPTHTLIHTQIHIYTNTHVHVYTHTTYIYKAVPCDNKESVYVRYGHQIQGGEDS